MRGNPVPLSAAVRAGVRNGWTAAGLLARVLIPAYVAVDLLARTPLIPAAADAVEPLTRLMGLPGEAAVPLVAGALVNLYAAIGAMAPLGLSAREVTILGLVLGICHGLVLETAVIRQVSSRWPWLVLARVGLGFLAGVLLHRVMP